jgi:acetyltransferase-like isoleucine patch superfamily enzyme
MSYKIPKIEHLVPTEWGWRVSYPDTLTLGNYVDIGCYTYIQAECGVIIEEYVQIGSHCSIYSKDTIGDTSGIVQIKENARIGTHSTIMPGVTIPPDTLIPAYSFVTTKGIFQLKREWHPYDTRLDKIN